MQTGYIKLTYRSKLDTPYNMEKIKEQAWKHLTKKEQMSLSLIVVSERSKKEASIVMNLSPYKFNEVYLRSRKFFLMFNEYYETYLKLVPESLPVPDDFKLYLNTLLKLRKKPSVINGDPVFQSLHSRRLREELWVKTLATPEGLEDTHREGFINLILEFDRWNNFRILPTKFQRPAAFPRRRVRGLKKIQQNLYAISALGWDMVKQNYEVTSPPFTYIPEVRSDDFGVIAVKQSRVNLDYFTENTIPLFRTLGEAKKFAELLYDYQHLSRKSSHSARKHWANFRILFNKAENYLELMNIKEADETTLTLKDRKFLASISKRKPKAEKPSSGETFWV